MSLDKFKIFVRNKPTLADYVKSGDMTWQDFYNMYELYGDNSTVWNKYLNYSSNVVTLKDLFDNIKNIDMTEVQNSITSLQKGIGYLEELINSKDNEKNIKKSTYEARPLYRYFDD